MFSPLPPPPGKATQGHSSGGIRARGRTGSSGTSSIVSSAASSATSSADGTQHGASSGAAAAMFCVGNNADGFGRASGGRSGSVTSVTSVSSAGSESIYVPPGAAAMGSLHDAVTPMGRPPPPPAPRYSGGSTASSAGGVQRRGSWGYASHGSQDVGRYDGAQHAGIGPGGIFAEPEPRTGKGHSLKDAQHDGVHASYAGCGSFAPSSTSSQTSGSRGGRRSGGGAGSDPGSAAASGHCPPESGTFSGHSRTPMDDITPCGAPRMMIRPSKPDKPSRSKRSLHMETPSKSHGGCRKNSNPAAASSSSSSTTSNIDGSTFSSFQPILSSSSSTTTATSTTNAFSFSRPSRIHDETTRSPWTSRRVDELTSMVDRNARIHSPHVALDQSPVDDAMDAVCQDIDMVIARKPEGEEGIASGRADRASGVSSATPTSSTIFGFSRPSRRRSKKPPSMMWTDKENSMNDATPSAPAGSVVTSSGGLRRRALRSGSSGSTGSFGDAEQEERDHRRRRKRSRTTDFGDASSTASNSFNSSRSSSRSSTPTPDLQEEGYRRDRRRSSSITTLLHALGVEVGESGGFGDCRMNSPHFSSSSSSSSTRRRRKSSSFGGMRATSYSQGSDFSVSGDIFDDEAKGRVLCQRIIGRMKHHGIRLLALDWDLTVLDCHTRNNWYGPATELARHIRPLFKHLMNQALAADVSVAIVTFSEQTRLVREAVASAIPAADGEASGGGARIIVRGCDQSWDSSEIFDRYFDRDLVCDDEPGSNAFGKLPHLASAMREVERREGGSAIDRDEVLLVDDDRQNCMIAGTQKLKTIVFHAEDVNRAFGEMGEMFSRSSRGGGPADFDSPAPKSVSGLRMSSAGKWTPGSGITGSGSTGGYRRK